ncbi:MAG: hypothetical protein H8E80_01025 [Desulfobacteraceae bacterium]|uniref:Uncharacterized protein n=1 Tax=Candidatus Desulfaltia bathyphila TaxID=2841697 RepID=A0A8J6N3S7_9BACT|nr:hypothetical protein [Candidatus Desulfaltia bathyphila]MBL7196388.1 hypothetical protein [Desulfobacterales bacterium]
MQKVIVYYFTKYDRNTDQEVQQKGMATLEFINRIGGTPLISTAKEIDVADLDDNGRYPKIKSTTD